MISGIFHTVVYNPLYNGLIYLVDVLPFHNMGLAVIILTVLVRTIIFPLSKKAIASQMAMKKAVPEVEELKKKFKNNSPEQTQAVFAYYKEHDIHPFAGLGVMLVQIPVFLALFWIFATGGLPKVNADILYPFVQTPEKINMLFLGFIDMGAKFNVLLAVLTAATQLAYSRLSMGPRVGKTAVEESLSADMARSFDLQVRYILPAVIGFVVYMVPAAASLYYVTSNLFMIGQEYAAGRRFYEKNSKILPAAGGPGRL